MPTWSRPPQLQLAMRMRRLRGVRGRTAHAGRRLAADRDCGTPRSRSRMRHASQFKIAASYGRPRDIGNQDPIGAFPVKTRMATLRITPTEAPKAPERGVRAATFRLLLDTAMAIIREGGHIPSVAEVAARSKVSRATAYRYFPSRSVLITAVINRSLEPVRSFKSK